MRILIQGLLVAGIGLGQCGSMVVNPLTGQLQCMGEPPMLVVTTLPAAAAARRQMLYRWSGATTTNYCPANGAGGSGGSATAYCVTHDGLNWQAVIQSDSNSAVNIGSTAINPATGITGPGLPGPQGTAGPAGPQGAAGPQGTAGVIPTPASKTLTSASSPYAVAASDNYMWVDATLGDVVCNLPTALGRAGSGYSFYKTSAGHKVTINALGTQKINGSSSYGINGGAGHVQIVSDGANWWGW